MPLIFCKCFDCIFFINFLVRRKEHLRSSGVEKTSIYFQCSFIVPGPKKNVLATVRFNWQTFIVCMRLFARIPDPKCGQHHTMYGLPYVTHSTHSHRASNKITMSDFCTTTQLRRTNATIVYFLFTCTHTSHSAQCTLIKCHYSAICRKRSVVVYAIWCQMLFGRYHRYLPPTQNIGSANFHKCINVDFAEFSFYSLNDYNFSLNLNIRR